MTDRDSMLAERSSIFLLILYIISGFLACLLALVVYQTIHFGNNYKGIDWLVIAAMMTGCFILIGAVRNGFVKSSAGIFLCIYFLGNAYGSYHWGASMPSGILAYSLFITIAGVILGRRVALIAAGLSAGSIIWSGLREYAQGSLPLWKTKTVTVEDLIAYTVMLALATFFSWLFTRSMEQSLERALSSEQALKIERDNLEDMVSERTRAWKEAELQRSAELGRFIEFGKLSAGLFHDLINPLSAVSLTFHELERKNISLPARDQARETIDRAVRSARRIEEQIGRFRKHMKMKSTSQIFNAAAELRDLCDVMQYQARERSVDLQSAIPETAYLEGDPIKFYQACANLVINSLESFTDTHADQKRHVSIYCQTDGTDLRLDIGDNGRGMKDAELARIFEPFFTTKPSGLGLGLAMVKDIIEEHFKGRIECRSSLGTGTTFSSSLPLSRPPTDD